MANNQFDEGTAQTKWAYFRFAIVGPLLTSPPNKKELTKALQALADKTWEHPITGEEIKIPDYFIPLDSKVAFALKNFDKAAQQELDRIVKKMFWEGLTPPKRVIAICALMSLPRLLNIPHLTAKIEKKVDWALNGVLKGNFRDQESFVSEETKAVSGGGDLEILVP